MITKRGNTHRLNIIENIDIDNTLPKYRKSDSVVNFDSGDFTTPSGFTGSRLIVSNSNSSTSINNSTFIYSGETGEFVNANEYMKESFWKNVCNKIKKFLKRKPTNVVKTFDLILRNTQELEIVKARAEGYHQLIEKAKSMGQLALAEKLIKELPIKMYEHKLFASNFKRFIDEQDIIKFALKCEKGLKLTYIKNYIRVIPSDVADKKKEADSLEIFDNYAILHYDPDGKATEMTDAEKEKAKDPILFGLIRNSTKLYFIGDWKDEMCDLTLEQIVNKLDANTETTLV